MNPTFITNIAQATVYEGVFAFGKILFVNFQSSVRYVFEMTGNNKTSSITKVRFK